MQCIYTYIPEIIHVPREYSVAAILQLLFMVHIALLSMLNVCTFTSVLSDVCVLCPIWLFSVVPWFRAFPVCCSGILWMTLRWFQLPPLLLVLDLCGRRWTAAPHTERKSRREKRTWFWHKAAPVKLKSTNRVEFVTHTNVFCCVDTKKNLRKNAILWCHWKTICNVIKEDRTKCHSFKTQTSATHFSTVETWRLQPTGPAFHKNVYLIPNSVNTRSKTCISYERNELQLLKGEIPRRPHVHTNLTDGIPSTLQDFNSYIWAQKNDSIGREREFRKERQSLSGISKGVVKCRSVGQKCSNKNMVIWICRKCEWNHFIWQKKTLTP